MADYNIAIREMQVGRDGCPGSLMAAEDFIRHGPQNFCKAFFNTTSKCGTCSNNMCETFNSYIIATRRLPLIDMLERIRRLLMVRQVEKRKVILKCHDLLCPNVRKAIEGMKEAAAKFIVQPSISEQFEVSMPYMEQERFMVDLPGNSCSCRSWDLHKIPCTHAMACINFMKRSVEDYIDPCYKMEDYRKTYGHVLQPLEGSKFWPCVDGEPIKPPPYKKLPGRPKKVNRKKSKEEDPKSSRSKVLNKGLGMKCSSCGNWGHNKRTCRGQPSSSQPAPSAAQPPSQQSMDEVSASQPSIMGGSQPSVIGKLWTVKCKLCGNYGHNKRTCSKKKAGGTTSSQEAAAGHGPLNEP